MRQKKKTILHRRCAIAVHHLRAQAHGSKVIVTHGTDTMIESASYVASKGAAHSKCVVFTGSMKVGVRVMCNIHISKKVIQSTMCT